MGRIDELPLDIFGEDDAPADGVPVSAEPVIPTGAPETVPDSSPALARSRALDAIAVVALAAGLGFAMRAVWMPFLLPVANAGIAGLLVARAKAEHRRWYYERAERVRERIAAELAALSDEPLPEQIATYRIVYDVGAVLVLAVAIHLGAWLTGVDRIIPDRVDWWISFATAIGAMVYVSARFNRTILYQWLYRRFVHDADHEPRLPDA